MKKNSWRHLFTLIATIIFTTLFIGLGVWQLQRAHDQALHTQLLLDNGRQQPLTVGKLDHLHDPSGLPVRVTGRFDNAHSFLLDNRFQHNQLGYDVITPFQTNHGQWLLVNRGWQPLSTARTPLQPTPSIAGDVTLKGISYRPAGNFFLAAPADDPIAPWPRHMAGVDLQWASKQLGKSLVPFTLRLDKQQTFTENTPFLRHWQPATRMTATRHRAYAVQWFIFAAIALGVYLVLTWRRLRRSN